MPALGTLWEDCGLNHVTAELDRAPDNKMQRNNPRLLPGDVRDDLIGVLSTSNLSTISLSTRGNIEITPFASFTVPGKAEKSTRGQAYFRCQKPRRGENGLFQTGGGVWRRRTGQHSLRQTVQSPKQLRVMEHMEEKSLDGLRALSSRLMVLFSLKLSCFFRTYLENLHTAWACQVLAKQTGKGMWLHITDADALHSVTSSGQKTCLQPPTQLQV